MLNINKHRLVMYQILNDIYRNRRLAAILGFKGGTACNIFYGLPRFSVDLDFNLLQVRDVKFVYDAIEKIIKKRGEIKNKYIKKNTIFFLLSYGKLDQNIKIEISTRQISNKYELRQFYGIAMPVISRSDAFANKLLTTIERKKIANRDLFDIYFFFENNWPINEKIIENRFKKPLIIYLNYLIKFIKKNVNNRYILQGLGELLNEKQKIWVKNNLKKELLNLISFYIDQYK
ncbi:MAG: nucleotidyl transferase AbiEii/AbiGii toxin family protein [Patescibacteria group bacterium]